MAGGNGKNKLVAALLALFLGGFGVHHFYLGSTMAGVICIAATWLTCGVGGILPFIEFIMLLVMSEADFDAKYNQRTPESMEFVFTKPQK
jgi:TM2 domain-containing membrane protein YozV